MCGFWIKYENKYVLNYEYNKAKTKLLYNAKENLDDEMILTLDEKNRDKIIERYYLENQNAPIAKYTQEYADALAVSNKYNGDRIETFKMSL
jgi:phage regulator Rha-like protein